MLDWDGTAVPDRQADATGVRDAIESACTAGIDVTVVSGTHVQNVDGQLGARPTGHGSLHLCLNRGSEVYRVTAEGPRLLWRRRATPAEDRALDRAAARTIQQLAGRGLLANLVSRRLNRRKIDLIPEPRWADPPKARIPQLAAAVDARLGRHGLAGLGEVVEIALEAARECGLPDPRVTSDAKHVEIGLTDKSDSARWTMARLWRTGVGPGLVLVIGDEFGPLGGVKGSDSLMMVDEAERCTAVSVGPEPSGVPAGVLRLQGGPAQFLRLIEEQVRHRRTATIPRVDRAPGWAFETAIAPVHRTHPDDPLFTLADGILGTTGCPLPGQTPAGSSVLMSGVYDGEGVHSQLLPSPEWHRLPGAPDAATLLRRTLDLHTGTLWCQLEGGEEGDRQALLFGSCVREGTAAMRSECSSPVLHAEDVLEPPPGYAGVDTGRRGGIQWMRVVAGTGGGVVAAAAQRRTLGSVLDRYASYRANPRRVPSPAAATAAAARAADAGFDRLFAEHRAARAARWEDADILIGGDERLQLAVRFALFHLMASVPDRGEAAVGARGLSGHGYSGHVFWDADVFVLPFLAATHPASARAMLEYRIRRLPAARAAARAAGFSGARFPWESAATGEDVTPTEAQDPQTGRPVIIRTGELEEHIVADVAWAARCYVDWTGDQEFWMSGGGDLLVETARYWASRVSIGRDGRAHILGVIGPDEYHCPVDDNAFTNVMARWNLRHAAMLDGELHIASEHEHEDWRVKADALVDGFDPATSLYEQFAGYMDLEDLVIEELAPRRPIAAAMLLGSHRVATSRVVKQADVLMLHHMVPDEVAPGSLEPNVEFYEPRTAHGSSLSPGVHAALLARTGHDAKALEALRLTSRIDIDDLTGTTAGGLHLAAMGSVWQAITMGFMGARPGPDALLLDPKPPAAWSRLGVRLRFRGARVAIESEAGAVRVRASSPVRVRLAGTQPVVVTPDGVRFERVGGGWSEHPHDALGSAI